MTNKFIFKEIKWFFVISASISYDFGPDGGLVTYAFPDSFQPDMNNDLLALGFITTKSNGVLFRVESASSSDYLQLEMVRLCFFKFIFLYLAE